MLSFQLRNAASDGDIDTVSRIIRENPGIINNEDWVIIRTALLFPLLLLTVSRQF